MTLTCHNAGSLYLLIYELLDFVAIINRVKHFLNFMNYARNHKHKKTMKYSIAEGSKKNVHIYWKF